MDLGRWSSRGEHDDFVVLVYDVLGLLFTFNNLIEWRVAQLVNRDLNFLDVALKVLAIFRFWSPFADSKDWTGLAKLREDQICILVEGLELLAQSASQSKRLDFDLQ